MRLIGVPPLFDLGFLLGELRPLASPDDEIARGAATELDNAKRKPKRGRCTGDDGVMQRTRRQRRIWWCGHSLTIVIFQ